MGPLTEAVLTECFNEVEEVIQNTAKKYGMDPEAFRDAFYEFFTAE